MLTLPTPEIPVHELQSWGFGPDFLAQLDLDELDTPHGPAVGRVIAASHHHYLLATAQGTQMAAPSGRLRQEELPVVGDWVVLRPDTLAQDGPALMTRMLQRRGAFIRRAPNDVRQVLAANVDLAFLTTSLNQDLSLRRIERYLTEIWQSGATPMILLTKGDLVADASAARRAVASVAPEVEVAVVSAVARSGLDPLLAALQPGRTAAFLGSSGVGKSTLLNALLGAELAATTPIRQDDGKGRHTTTSRQLFRRPEGGLLLDQPGLREVGLWEGADGLSRTFADVDALLGQCRWRDCQHNAEPGCAIAAALEQGRLDPGRWESWVRLQRELHHEAVRQDAVAQRAERERWKRIHQDAEARMGFRDRQRW